MRIRTIKPEFFTHESLFDAEVESGLPLRIAFAGLWCAADREGRFKWEVRRLKSAILPFDNLDFSRVLDALVTRGFLVRYASNGVEFGCIPSFSKHQVINNRERPSEIPSPTESTILTRAPRVSDACPTPLCLAQAEGKGREHGKERKGDGSSEQSDKRIDSKPTSRKKLCDDEFIAELKRHYPEINVESELRKMDAWLMTRPGKTKTRRFAVNWLNRCDPGLKPANRKTEADRDRENTGLDEGLKLKRL